MKTFVTAICMISFLVGCIHDSNVEPSKPSEFSYVAPKLREGRLVFDNPESFSYLLTIPKQDKEIWDMRWREIPSFATIDKVLKQSNEKSSLLDSHSLLLNKLMSDKGVLEVGGNLLNFNSESTKILVGYTGTQSEIDFLLGSTTSSENGKVIIYPVKQVFSIVKSSQARSTNFNTCQNGNYVYVGGYSSASGSDPAIVASYIQGCVVGYQRATGVPGQAPTRFYYTVSATVNIYFTDGDHTEVNNDNTSGIFFNWVTDKGSSSANNTTSVQIYGAFAARYPQDIEGYVNMGNDYSNFYYVFSNDRVSQTTVSF